MGKTLKNFLKKHGACKDNFDFAKDLTLEEFLITCNRGAWILWLFAKMNPKALRELTLAKGHCANTVREHMKDERSAKAVDVAIAFGEGRATIEELRAAAAVAAYAAFAAYVATEAEAAWAVWAAAAAAAAANAATEAEAAWAAAAAKAAYAANAAASVYNLARKRNQKLTADICRKYLPLEIWNQNLI